MTRFSYPYRRDRRTGLTSAVTEARYITAKYAGKCYGCGQPIAAGAACEYWPGKGIGHYGAFSGDGDKMGACYAARKAAERDPGFVDLDRMYEDQCSDICGR